MKKLLTILMCLVLSLSMALAVGCGGEGGASVGSDDPAFAGNYKEATKQELLDFADELEEVEGAYELDWSKGLKMEYKQKSDIVATGLMEGQEDSYGVKADSTMSFITSNVDGNFLMSGAMNIVGTANGEAANVNAKYYYANSKLYTESDGVKTCIDMANYEDVFSNFALALSMLENLDVASAIRDLESEASTAPVPGAEFEYSYSMDKSEEGTKLKVACTGDMDVSESGVSMELSFDAVIVFAFNAENKLIAYNTDMIMYMDMDMGDYGSVTTDSVVSMFIAPNDTEVELPSDLESYNNSALA